MQNGLSTRQEYGPQASCPLRIVVAVDATLVCRSLTTRSYDRTTGFVALGCYCPVKLSRSWTFVFLQAPNYTCARRDLGINDITKEYIRIAALDIQA